MGNIPVGLQMFTLRNETEKDFVGTLEKVAKIGYQGVEFAGYGGLSAKELKKTLDSLGLKAASSHIQLQMLQDDLDAVIAYAQEIGNKNVVIPFLTDDQRNKEFYYGLIDTLNDAGRKLHDAGITLSYHNHDFELQPLDNGKKPLELLFDETNPEWVQTELDIYWLTKAGENPVEWVKKYHNRTPLVHLKDMTTDGDQFFAELGTGGVDIDGVMDAASKSNVEWWIVEQDQTRRTPLESIEISYNYLKNKLGL